MQEKITKRIDLIKEEFEKRANCKVMFIDVSKGNSGVEIMIELDVTEYEPIYFTSIKYISQIAGKMVILGFVSSEEFDCLIN